jgi:hypothetical protein
MRGKAAGEHEPKHPAVKSVLAAWNEGAFSGAEKCVAPNVAVSMNGSTYHSTPEGDGPAMARRALSTNVRSCLTSKMDLLQEIREKNPIAIE